MKASELMVGDWVYDTILKGNTRVEILSLSGIRGDFHENVWNENTFEPIPLTPEILEKNGMKVFEHRNPWQNPGNLIKKWYSKDGRFYVSYYRVGDMFTYTVGNGVSRVCGIKYIHQLQNTLRLCGIEKEIEL